jgi:hypothetical protein
MPLSIWTQASGFRFASIEENTLVDINLPVQFPNGFDDSSNLTLTIVAGQLPPGIRIKDQRLFGSAREVPRSTDFKFVIRAQLGTEISDRTFFITVNGSDDPIWQTPAGSLAVFNSNQYYVLDSSYIDFQLVATDQDTAAGQVLKYNKIRGELPPGLILTETGRIVGFIQPALSISEIAGGGAYDTTIFDYIAYDIGERPTNGYDSFLFENTLYDYATPSLSPKKLNRYYEFVVKVSDGDSSFDRTFKIFVVGDDYFKSDSISIKTGSGTFTVDTTFVRAPIWVTPKNLGIYRASNYHTYKLDIYDDKNLGPVNYELDAINPRIKAIASTTSSSENKITTNKIRITETDGVPNLTDKVYLKNWVERYIIPENPGDPIQVIQADDTVYNITHIETVNSSEYVLTVYPNLTITIPKRTAIGLGPVSEIPPGMNFDVGSGEVFGVIPYQTNITLTYNFTVIAYRSQFQGDHIEIGRSRRTFTVTILGTVDSVISWDSDSNLGQLPANLISNLFVKATTTIPNTSLYYVIKSGSLPPGLTLNLDGEIIGKVNQYGDVSNPGLITFDDTETTFDNTETTFDKVYRFTITARDMVNFDSSDKEFTLEILTPNEELYSNISAKPFFNLAQRNIFKSFINNTEIFVPNYIYRPDDPNFGVQKNLKMLIYAGIETQTANTIARKMILNHRRKRFILGNIKSAQAKLPGTNTVVYEIIYLEIIDPLEINGKTLPNVIKTSDGTRAVTVDQNNAYNTGPFDQLTPYWGPADPFYAPVDSNFVFAGDSYTSWKFPSSITLWRKRIKELGLRDRNYLPLWMRSVQEGSVVELDFQLAAPLCYCKPGYSKDILLNIKNNYFDFTQLDYEIDRYIIDSVTGDSSDKYLVFRNDRTTIS